MWLIAPLSGIGLFQETFDPSFLDELGERYSQESKNAPPAQTDTLIDETTTTSRDQAAATTSVPTVPVRSEFSLA